MAEPLDPPRWAGWQHWRHSAAMTRRFHHASRPQPITVASECLAAKTPFKRDGRGPDRRPWWPPRWQPGEVDLLAPEPQVSVRSMNTQRLLYSSGISLSAYGPMSTNPFARYRPW